MSQLPQLVTPKQLRLLPIARTDARRLIIARHESQSCPMGIQIAYGCFFEKECLGAVVFALGTQMLYNIIEGGKPGEVWELARLWLDDRCAKNSESRMLAIACELVRKKHPRIKAVVTYTTPTAAIYKAAGFLRVPGDRHDKIFIINGEHFYSTRAVSGKFKTFNQKTLMAAGHKVETIPTVRCRWWKPLHEGIKLRVAAEENKHPDEAAVIALWRKDAKWLGWPGTFAFREALQRNSCVLVRDEKNEIVGAWLFHRLLTRPIFRDIGCVVRGDQRGRGVGRQLIDGAKQMADRERRCIAFDCKVTNPACGFWDKYFSRIGTRARGKDKEVYYRYFYASKAYVAMRPAHQPGEGGSIPTSTLPLSSGEILDTTPSVT